MRGHTRRNDAGIRCRQSKAKLAWAARCAVAGTTILLAQQSADALIINPTFSANVNALPNAATVQNAFNYAKLQIENLYSDNFTLNMTVDATSSAGALGGSSTFLEGYYNYAGVGGIRAAMVADSKGANDASAYSTLPVSDPTGGTHTWATSQAQMRALNLAPVFTPNASDGTFTFGTNVFGGPPAYPNNYTFDPLNRAQVNKFDWIGVATHEITEIMGRIPGLGTNFGGGGPDFMPMDLFHFTGTGVHNFTNGAGRYFSIDNGVTHLKNYNNAAAFGGDPQDWESALGGVPPDSFNAFNGPGVLSPITPVDVIQEDVIGYDLTSLVWKGNVNGTWDIFNTSNWQNTNGSAKFTDSALALFDDTGSAVNTAITLNQNVYPTSVTFNSNVNNYTVSGTGSIYGLGSVVKSGNSTVTINTLMTYTGTTTVNGGRLVLGSNLTTSSQVTVNSGGTLEIKAGSGVVIKTPLLVVNGTGKVNIQDGKMILPGNAVGTLGGGGIYTGVTGLIQAGRNGNTLPLWDGNGIITSQTTATGGNLTSIGVARGDQVKPQTTTTTAVWGGQVITGSDTLVMYTYGGDANLDGKINVDDYGRIDANIPLGTSGWFNGDFNYDGKINVDDYGIIDFNVGIQGAPFPTGSALSDSGGSALGGSPGGGGPGIALTSTTGGLGNPGGASAVPEPAGLALAAAGGSFLLFRRRNQRR